MWIVFVDILVDIVIAFDIYEKKMEETEEKSQQTNE